MKNDEILEKIKFFVELRDLLSDSISGLKIALWKENDEILMHHLKLFNTTIPSIIKLNEAINKLEKEYNQS